MVEKRQRSMVNGQRELPREAEARALALLEAVKDPEVPVLSVVELGIVRDVELDDAGAGITITVTPTYSGCPAMRVIEEEIVAALEAGGFRAVAVKVVYAPAWTTDWIPEPAREKLRAYGIAPPGEVTAEQLVPLGPVVVRGAHRSRLGGRSSARRATAARRQTLRSGPGDESSGRHRAARAGTGVLAGP